MRSISTVDSSVIAEYKVLFEMLGLVFYQPPNKEFVDSIGRHRLLANLPNELVSEGTNAGCRRMDTWCEAYSVSPEKSFELIKSEYMELFVGTQQMQVIPWESAYLSKERLLFQEQTFDVRRFYRKHNVQIANRNHEPEDHIGLEVGFMALLADRALGHLNQGEIEEAREVLSDSLEFLEKHLQQWSRRWAIDVTKVVTSGFYDGCALILSGSLASYEEYLSS